MKKRRRNKEGKKEKGVKRGGGGTERMRSGDKRERRNIIAHEQKPRKRWKSLTSKLKRTMKMDSDKRDHKTKTKNEGKEEKK